MFENAPATSMAGGTMNAADKQYPLGADNKKKKPTTSYIDQNKEGQKRLTKEVEARLSVHEADLDDGINPRKHKKIDGMHPDHESKHKETLEKMKKTVGVVKVKEIT
jgi:hypothetical protein